MSDASSKWKKLKSKFYTEEGGKLVFNFKLLAKLLRTLFGLGIVVYCLMVALGFGDDPDTSRISRSTKPVKGHAQTGKANSQDSQQATNVGGVSERSAYDGTQKRVRRARPKIKVNYKAKQVLVSSHSGVANRFPIGTNLVGKLLTSIDTRSKQMVKAILPYDVKSKRGDGEFPAGTIFLGSPSYSGSGEKVFIQFDRGVLPTGEEFNIHAQALDSEDYSAGVQGEFHGNFGVRTAAVLGLSMVSGVSEVMVEKEALGQGFNVTPKASVKNGLYNGISKVADMETNRQAQKLHQAPEYVTVEAGKDLIISLTGSYRGKK
jgi:hypothetical protein